MESVIKIKWKSRGWSDKTRCTSGSRQTEDHGTDLNEKDVIPKVLSLYSTCEKYEKRTEILLRELKMHIGFIAGLPDVVPASKTDWQNYLKPYMGIDKNP